MCEISEHGKHGQKLRKRKKEKDFTCVFFRGGRGLPCPNVAKLLAGLERVEIKICQFMN
jgi:hypothetical protein